MNRTSLGRVVSTQPPFSVQPGSLFPMDSLSSAITAAARDIQTITQAPAEMIVAQCLGIAATACQEVYDVDLKLGSRAPVSLCLDMLGASGERESATDQYQADGMEAA